MHPSTLFHLNTETALLSTLHTRSKAQHRSQLFLRNLAEVIRLATALSRSCSYTLNAAPSTVPSATSTRISTPAPASVSARSTPTPVPRLLKTAANNALSQQEQNAAAAAQQTTPASSSRAPALVEKLIPALVRAGAATRRMLELHHFVPLQTLLMAAYARLLGVALHIAADLGVGLGDTEALLSGTWDKRAAALAAEESVAVAAAVSVSVSVSGGDDVGERISRPGLKREVEAEGGRAKRTKVAGSREGTDSIAETEMAEAKVDTEPEPKDKPSDTEVKKRNKASDLDDIFAAKPKPKKTKAADATRDQVVVEKKKASELDDIFASKPKKDGKVADKKQKKKKADGPDDGLSKAPKAPTSKVAKGDGEVKSSGSKVEKKKKKGKKDAMDDIFGF